VKSNSTIQLKAIFLLIVFSLNTVIGFACSVGLDMGFNSKHHHHHHNGKSHHHHHDNSQINKSGASETGNCCNEGTTRFFQSDKLLVNTVNAGIEMPVALIALHFLYISSHLSSFNSEIIKIQEVRPFVLNSRGIRVSIQSFQI